MPKSVKEYAATLLKLMDSLPHRQGRANTIIAQFEEQYHDEIPATHYRKNPSGRVRWIVRVQWGRQKAVDLGLMDSPARGIWRLTEEGHRWVVEHPDATRLEDVEQPRPTTRRSAEDEQESDKRSPYKSFFEATKVGLETLLPASMKALNPKLNTRSNRLYLRIPTFRGCHYEIRLAREYHEIALHFESSRKRNQTRLQAFEPNLDSLRMRLGETVRQIDAEMGQKWHWPLEHTIHADDWGPNHKWTRVWIKLPHNIIPTDAELALLAACYSRLAGVFIDETWPVLQSVYANESSRRRKPPIPLLGGQHSILDREIENIRAFLQGRSDHRPSDEKLCDWVQFCYTFEMYAEGRSLFALVNSAEVHPWYLERTKKLAQVCALKAGKHG